MKRYKSILEEIDSVEAQISGLRDSIKKLEFQNSSDEIDLRYVDKSSSDYNEKINKFRDRMNGRRDSIKKLNQQIADIKAGMKNKTNGTK